MNWWGRLLKKRRVERELEAELRDHFERAVAENVRKGMSEEDARRLARLAFGGLDQIKEECRDARGTLWLENTLQDIRSALRTLRKNRGFAAAAICTLALGIGANTAIFDVINGVLLRPLPYKDPGRLVDVEQTLRTGESWTFSYPDYLDLARQSRSLESMAAWRTSGANLTSPGDPEFFLIRQVSADFLQSLGVRPILGRNFNAEEDHRGAAPVAIISHSLWRERFGGRRDVIGSRIVLNGKGSAIVGVLPAGFRFLGDFPILMLIGQSDDMLLQRRDSHPGIQAIGRLKPGITREQANAELKVIADRLARAYPDTDANFTFRVVPLKQQILGDVGFTLYLLAGAVGLVLLIACVNVANLFLARSISRTREFALRAALGASRWRLIKQLLTESLLLSFIGGAAGFMIASSGTQWAVAHLPGSLPRTDEISVDARVLLFTLAASILSGVAFGVAPGFRRRFQLDTELRQGARGSGRGIQRTQSAFVIAQLALALVLLAGSGLMLRTVAHLWGVSPGFVPQNLLAMTAGLSPKALKNPALIRNAWQQMLDRVRSTPGVKAAALDSIVPLSGNSNQAAYWTTSTAQPPKNAPMAFMFTPTPDYLRTMKIPLLRGRFFTEQDRLGSAPVVVIDETMARRLFPGENPVGSELSVDFIGKARIIGVVGAVKHMTLNEDAYAPPQPAVYMPLLQFPDSFMPLTAAGLNLLVRTSVKPLSMLPALKKSVAGPAGDEPVHDVKTMEQLIGNSMGQQRGISFLLGIFAALALALAAVGIYSVISYSMSRRVQEIGIRMALGAQPGQVLRLVLAQGLRMLAAGIALGIAASSAVTHLLGKLLFGVTPDDPLTFAAVVLALGAIALFAVYVPARRAARIDPMLALRHE
jgi:predicted permease